MITENNLMPLLKSQFGFDSFLPNQEEIVNEVLRGKDVLAVMPTGGGKSLCFQLPALALEGITIVVSPLIALMKDQVDSLKANGIAAAYYNSSIDYYQRTLILQDLMQNKFRLFYVAPESLQSLFSTLQKCTINLIAVDEAHCISAWGHDFRPDYMKLGNLKEKFPEVPILALTATADAATQDDILVQLKIPKATKHIASFDRKNLFLEVRLGQDRKKQIFDFLKEHPDQSGIIYCLSRKTTESLTKHLLLEGYKAAFYHAGMDAKERSRVQEDFIHDQVPIIVSTIAFGMGIDKSNVRWVIHYNLPKNIEGYYQEIGRSGRDGLLANALLFYSIQDTRMLRSFFVGSPTEEIQAAKLDRMVQFAEALSCRRIALLSYFGEHTSGNCGNCDVCRQPPEYFDGSKIAQAVFKTVALLKGLTGVGTIIDVLRGLKNSWVIENKLDQLPIYGYLKPVSTVNLQQYIIQLTNQGFLEIKFHQKGRVTLTSLGRSVMQASGKVYFALPKKISRKSYTQNYPTPSTSDLFGKLKKLRLHIAEEEKMPAYVIFSDASLKQMEEKMPISEEEFAKITGVGEVKLLKYAPRFLKEIINHKYAEQPSHKISFAFYKRGLNPEQIAARRNIGLDTVYSHLLKAYDEGDPLDFDHLISSKEIKKIEQAKHQLKETERLKPYFDFFSEKVPYWKIRYGLYALNKRGVIST